MNRWLEEYVDSIMKEQIVVNGIFTNKFIRALAALFRYGRIEEGQSSVSTAGAVLHECSD